VNRAACILSKFNERKKHSIHNNPYIRARIKDRWATKKIHPRWTYLKTHRTLKKPFENEEKSLRHKKIYATDKQERQRIRTIYKGS
jgi:hypothetical protein